MDAEQLSRALKAVSATHWSSKQQPVLLSALPMLLKDHLNADYKDALNGETLKDFIKRTSVAFQYRLVEHPTQKAKLGLVPAEVPFEFPTIPISSSVSLTTADAHAFARVLLSLTEEEQRAVLLPGTLVAKLITAK